MDCGNCHVRAYFDCGNLWRDSLSDRVEVLSSYGKNVLRYSRAADAQEVAIEPARIIEERLGGRGVERVGSQKVERAGLFVDRLGIDDPIRLPGFAEQPGKIFNHQVLLAGHLSTDDDQRSRPHCSGVSCRFHRLTAAWQASIRSRHASRTLREKSRANLISEFLERSSESRNTDPAPRRPRRDSV